MGIPIGTAETPYLLDTYEQHDMSGAHTRTEYESVRGVTLPTIAILGEDRWLPLNELVGFVSSVSGVMHEHARGAIRGLVVRQEILPDMPPYRTINPAKPEVLAASQAEAIPLYPRGTAERSTLEQIVEEFVAVHGAQQALAGRIRGLHRP
jgi:hypothetical protein